MLVTNPGSIRGERRNAVKRFQYLTLLAALASAGMAAGAGSAAADTCSNLATSLNLTDITVTAAQTVPAGNYTAANGQTFQNLPTFCRIAADGSPDQPVRYQLRSLDAAGGNLERHLSRKGSGGSAGSITFSLMANAIARNYATMSNDNGHTGATGHSRCSLNGLTISAIGRSTSRPWRPRRLSMRIIRKGQTILIFTGARRAAITR